MRRDYLDQFRELLGKKSYVESVSHRWLCFCLFVNLASERSAFAGTLDKNSDSETGTNMSLSLYFCGLNWMPDMGYNTWSRRASHSLSAHFMLLPEARQSHLTGSGQLAFFETSLAFSAAWQNSNCHSLSGYVTETDKVNYGIHLKQ